MKIQIITLGVLLAAARGVVIPSEYERYFYGPTSPVSVGPLPSLGFPASVAKPEPFSRPEYTYGYDVHDPISGDSKNQHESRDGDVVRGGYSFIESDGSRRIVNYFSDPINGFNAIVRNEPAVATPTPVVEARPAAVAVVRPAAATPVLLPTAAVSPVEPRPAAVAIVKPATVSPVVEPKPAAVAVVRPAPVAVTAPAIRFHPPAATFAPLPFVLGRHGYGYSHTPFGLSYY